MLTCEVIVVPDTNGWVLSGARQDERSLYGNIHCSDWTWVESFGELINNDFLVHRLVESNGLHVDEVDVVVLTSCSDLLFAIWWDVERDDWTRFNRFVFEELPVSDEVKSSCVFALTWIVLFSSHPHCHVASVRSTDETFGELSNTWDIVDLWSTKRIVNHLSLLIVLQNDDFTFWSCSSHHLLDHPDMVSVDVVLLH